MRAVLLTLVAVALLGGIVFLVSTHLGYRIYVEKKTEAGAANAPVADSANAPIGESAEAAPTLNSLPSPADEILVDLTQFEAQGPVYMLHRVFPLCGVDDNVTTYDSQKKTTEFLIPFCHHLKGDLNSSNVKSFEILAVDGEWVEIKAASEKNQVPDSVVGAPVAAPSGTPLANETTAKYWIKLKDLGTPVMLEKNGRRWPTPFLEVKEQADALAGRETWCESELSKVRFLKNEGLVIQSFVQGAFADDCQID